MGRGRLRAGSYRRQFVTHEPGNFRCKFRFMGRFVPFPIPHMYTSDRLLSQSYMLGSILFAAFACIWDAVAFGLPWCFLAFEPIMLTTNSL